MKHLKTYKIFESQSEITDDIKDIMIELEDKGFLIDISYWVNGAKGGFLRSDETGKQLYGSMANDGKLYIEVGVKKIEPAGNFLTKDGFNWRDAKPAFDRLRSFLEKHSQVKYKIKTILFAHEPRFSVSRKSEIQDRYQTSFDYCDSKYIEKDFTDKNTLTSVSYFFERI